MNVVNVNIEPVGDNGPYPFAAPPKAELNPEIVRLTTERDQLASENRGGVALLARIIEQRDLAEAGRELDKKTIQELDAELADANITIQASMSCTTHYSDLLGEALGALGVARDALKSAKSAIKGREHAGFIDEAITAIDAIGAVTDKPRVERNPELAAAARAALGKG